MGICGVAVLMFSRCCDAVNKISICGVVVVSNLTVCDVFVFHAAVFSEMKLFAVLWFLVWLGDAMFVFFFVVLQCSGPPISPSLHKMVEYLTEGQEVIFLDCYRMQSDKFCHNLIHLKLLVLLTIILMQGGRGMCDGILYLMLWKYMLRRSWTVLGSSNLHCKEEYRYTSLFWRKEWE